MRPGQNKRMRGRNNNGGGNNRKGPNPLTRSYESNGPDVKIRGTAHHIGEKYLQLARDAQSSGDPVMAESYLQHAEHYFRLIATAQQAQQQAAYGYQRPAGEQVEDDDGDDDYSNLPDRFASPSERVAQQPAPQPYEQRQPERQGYNGGDRQSGERQPFEQRGGGDRPYERQQQAGYAERQNDRHQNDGGERQDRPQQDRHYNDRQQYDRNGGRGHGDRPFPGRDGNRDANREAAREPAERQSQPQAYAPERVTPSERPFQAERPSPDRPFQDRQPRDQDRQPRDYDNRPRGRGPRPFRENGEGRPADTRQTEGHQPEPRQLVADEPVNGLPAFITAPTRAQPDPVASEAVPDVPRAKLTPAAASEDAAPPSDGEGPGFLLRPRRRRRPRSRS